MRMLVLALALGACTDRTIVSQPGPAPDAEANAAAAPVTPPWEEAGAAGVDFRAIGQEPGWLLDIYTQDRIMLDWDYGERRAEFPLTEPTYPQEGATRYDARANGHTLSVTIRRFPCQDAMSGDAFPASVEVIIDGRALQGCGRTV